MHLDHSSSAKYDGVICFDHPRHSFWIFAVGLEAVLWIWVKNSDTKAATELKRQAKAACWKFEIPEVGHFYPWDIFETYQFISFSCRHFIMLHITITSCPWTSQVRQTLLQRNILPPCFQIEPEIVVELLKIPDGDLDLAAKDWG